MARAAPFAFTYRRIGRDGSIESKQFTGINEDEFHFHTDLGGKFELVSVSDKFCRFPQTQDS